MGLGAALALLCDIATMVETAKIADPHVVMGLSAGDGGALLSPLLSGFARARHCLLTGDPLTRVEAAAIGLIHQAVHAEELDATVFAYAARLCKGATYAIKATKRSINMSLLAQAQTIANANAGVEQLAFMSEDHREAVLAFQQKRPPVFTGR